MRALEDQIKIDEDLLKDKKKELGMYDERFKEGLKQLSKMYKQLPDYLIKMMVEEKSIPSNEGELLIRKYVQLGVLIPLKTNYFKIKIAK